MRLVPIALLICGAAAAQTKTTFEDFPAYSLSNGRMEAVILTTGGTIASLMLADDKEKINPLWNPVRMARESGATTRRFGAGLGHFLCVDGFGGVSKDEAAAGLQGHGEAHRQQFAAKVGQGENGKLILTLEAELPMLQEHVVRSYEMREGETVLYVRTQLQSMVAFDRPLVWAEHGTIGSPFLEAGATIVDAPYKRAQTRPYTTPEQHRLASGKDFEWPMAPRIDGKTVDIRSAPVALGSGDHTTGLMDPMRDYAFATALHPGKRLMVGWVWRRSDFPWLQNWENYPSNGKLARGLEFSTQPYDIPRREAVDMHSLFDTPTYQWLPAKATVQKSFVMFYAPVPNGMTKVTDVRWEKGQLLIEDGLGHRISLRATGSL